MARRSAQTVGKREREQARREKRERKQEKKAAAAAARTEQSTPAAELHADESTSSEAE